MAHADTESDRPLAVVTGASSGIGLELAREFAEHGYDLLITAENGEIAQAAQSLRELGGEVESVQVDLAKYYGVETLYKRIKALHRPVHAIAINAGVGVGGEFVRETDLQDELHLISLNVTSSVHLAKLVVKDMVEQGHGRVLFTSSIAALTPAPLEAVYGASKAFLLSFSQALREEVRDSGVIVTALLPGPTETNFFHRAGMDNTRVGQMVKDSASMVARQGFQALMSGVAKAIAGSLGTQVEGFVSRIIPDILNARSHRRLAEPTAPNG